MMCCSECFGDRGLRKSIIPLRSTETGKCSYCGTDKISLIAPAWLSDYFELLANAYRRDDNGKSLVRCFREDWGMFDHLRMNDDRANALLAEIFDDAGIVQGTFLPAIDHGADRLGEWEKLREELRYHNRFFPEVNIDLDRLQSLLSPLTLDPDEVPHVWYRARIQSGEAHIRLPTWEPHRSELPRMVGLTQRAFHTSISDRPREQQFPKSDLTPGRSPASRTFKHLRT